MSALTSFERDDLRRMVSCVVSLREEVGVSRIQSDARFSQSGLSGVRGASRRDISRALRELGWRRDGWIGIGYDREPRYVR
jgi:hypothetical protein